MLRIVVPGKPIGKGRARAARVGNGVRMFTPQTTVNYESLIALAGQQAMQSAPLMEGAVSVTAFAHFPIPKSWTKKRRAAHAERAEYHISKPDGSNVLKALEDGLNGIVWQDDCQIAQAQIIKLYGETPQLIIEVRPL